jgi:YVTN family beta-propeller protein
MHRRLGNLAFGLALCGLVGCGGGGGGGNDATNLFGPGLEDPVLALEGSSGGGATAAKFSLTPQEANSGMGTDSLAQAVTTENHWFRVVFPLALDANSIFNPQGGSSSITVLDDAGQPLAGMALVGGEDANGDDRSVEAGFPVDPDPATGEDRNAQKNVFLFIADLDDDFTTLAAFGDLNGAEVTVSTTTFVRVEIDRINGAVIDALWTINVDAGAGPDSNAPFVTKLRAEKFQTLAQIDSKFDPNLNPDPMLNPALANTAVVEVTTSFIVQFNEPVVPQSVGRSAMLNGAPFRGNMPVFPASSPNPNIVMTSTITAINQNLFVPFDVEPINTNNLATYRLRPLINLASNDLPPINANPWVPTVQVDVLIHALFNNPDPLNVGQSVTDLNGNVYDGQDANNMPNQTDFRVTFTPGPGPSLVNVPVSPEVVYWLPSIGRGIGAIDLNGAGFTTNTPGANSTDPTKAPILTRLFSCPPDAFGCPQPKNIGGLNLSSGQALTGHPAAQNCGCGAIPMGCPAPTVPCPWNSYFYPVGTGSFAYGNGITPGWEAVGGTFGMTIIPPDPGNVGTPLPGVNEMSSGFETLCRDSRGEVILTGTEFSEVGVVEDLVVGEFLDTIFFDTDNFHAGEAFHVSIFDGAFPHTPSQGRNIISDPPSPNPPPLRYWLGLPPLNVVIDQLNPSETTFLIEGEEVFCGTRDPCNGFVWLKPNPDNPVFGPDVTQTPHFAVGPGMQSTSPFLVFTFSARQQIGNFLYATDVENRLLHSINSNTMRVINSISLPDPTGLGISPAGDLLYVSNFSADTVSIVDTDPFSPSFHTEIARVPVGVGPKSVAVQPDNEDVFICNFLGDTVSVLDPQSLTVRKEVTALINGPFDVAVSDRQLQPGSLHPFGFGSGVYFAYISNFDSDNVVVFESGPSGAQGIGFDDVLGQLPTTDDDPPIFQPRGLCFSPLLNPQQLAAGGIFVAHKDDQGFGQVSHIQFSNQIIFGPLPRQAPPGFIIPPGFLDRTFEVTSVWGNNANNRLAGVSPSDVTLADMNFASYSIERNPVGAPNFGSPALSPPRPESTGFVNSRHHMRLIPNTAVPVWNPDRLYVSFTDTDVIQVLDPQNAGVVLNTIEGNGGLGVKKLAAYWHQ